MSERDEAIRRALQALREDELDHPGHETLEAYVEGRLRAEDAAVIDRLAAQSAIVAEDIADLRRIHAALTLGEGRSTERASHRVEARKDIRWGRYAAVGAAAAALIAAVWIARPAPVAAPTVIDQPLTAAESSRVEAARTNGRIAVPESIAALAPREGTLLGQSPSATLRLRSPIGTAVIFPRPQFTWEDSGADAYTVAVFDQNFSEVARGRVTGTSWRPDVDLPRGGTYSWQVTAHRGATSDTEPRPPRPEARFTVIDQATADRIVNLQARLDASHPLPLGILLAELGLIEDARVQLARAAQVPATADIARRLLDSLDQGTPMTTKPAQ